MPTISEFFGIVIRMYVKDHPPPHFHAIHGDYEARIAVETGDIIEGALPVTARRFVREWANSNRERLTDNWRRRELGLPLERVIQIAVVGRYGLAVRFQDGASGIHDCTALVREEGPMIEPLREPSYFADVRREHGAPTWPNGYDICPDWLRLEMKAAGELSEPLAAE